MIRDIHTHLLSLITDQKNNDVIIVEGARQVGKSYLVNNILEEISTPCFSFDLEKDLKFRRSIDSTEDFEDFRILMQDTYSLKGPCVLFIDEAQESLRLASNLK